MVDAAQATQTSRQALGHLAAYERALRAAAGTLRPPVQYLSDNQLSALFASRQIDLLVRRPFETSSCQETRSPTAALYTSSNV
jgi:hypothetical protein